MSTFNQRREAALEILTSDVRLTRKAGSFLGQLVVDDRPLTQPQSEWLHQLAEKAGVDAGRLSHG